MRNIDLNTAIICNVPKKSDHCIRICLHGVPHEKTNERKEGCHLHLQFCNLGGSGIRKVQCRLLTEAEKDFFHQKFLKRRNSL